MTAPRFHLLTVAAAAVLASATPALRAQVAPATGTVRGSVFDSTTAAPLADAAVFLWDTPYRATSDSLGHFSIEGVPPGDYQLVYFHTRLGEMGISPGSTPVSVRAGATVQVHLATPSVFTLTTSSCLFEAPTEGTAVLAGFVADGDTGMGMPGARVTLSWRDEEGSLRGMELRTDGLGWYRTCAAPAAVPVVVAAEFLDRKGLRQERTLEPGSATELGFLLFPMSTTDVTGRLVDAESGSVVEGAEVRLRGTAHYAVTDPSGNFRMLDVDPGRYVLVATHLAYGTRGDTLEVPSGQALSVEMRLLPEAIEIEPVTVTVEGRPLTERAMGGIVIDRVQVDRVRRRARDVADLLRSQNIPGVIVRRRGDGTMCVGYMPGQVRMMFNTGCVPMVIFINNVRATNTELALQLPPESIDHMVIYKPLEAGNLFGSGSMNGVLAIYTRGR